MKRSNGHSPARSQGQPAPPLVRLSAGLVPLSDTDALTAAEFLKRSPPAHERIRVTYRCRCGNRIELHIQTEAVVCVRCGSRMRPVTT